MRRYGDEDAPPDHRADVALPDAALVDVIGYARTIGHHHALLVQVLGIPLSEQIERRRARRIETE
ncbi:MAG: hypothetical protein MI924_36815 [Chloroflexales bacterium]|nr:hypothetical protein [Chloroflexales bacterium]